jgi:hypothetical protein
VLKTKRERLEEICRRLALLPPSSTFEEMREQLERTINEVEDEWTPFPYNPADLDPANRRIATDRIYPVQDDNVNDVHGHSTVKQLTSAGHHTFIRSNGSIEIRSKKCPDGSRATPPQKLGTLILEKDGHDGRGVWEL